MKSLALMAAAGLLAVGCAAAPPEPLPTDHPAHPDAPASPLPPVSHTLDLPADAVAPDPTDVVPGAHHATEATAQATTQPAVYACPMHSKVVAAAPGNCPECGMQLRPKGGRP